MLRNKLIYHQRSREETPHLRIEDEFVLYSGRAVDQQISCAFVFDIVGEPGVKRPEIPFIEIVIEAILSRLLVLVWASGLTKDTYGFQIVFIIEAME